MSFPHNRESGIQHIWGSEAIEARANGMMPAADEKAALALLDWYRAMGVDEAIGEAPVDCFAAAADFKPAPRPAPEVPEGYLIAGHKVMTDEQYPSWVEGVKALYDEMVVITITLTWAKLLDFETTIPKAVEDLVKEKSAS
jgi:hypothetical protein